jgi:hypothetical protein
LAISDSALKKLSKTCGLTSKRMQTSRKPKARPTAYCRCRSSLQASYFSRSNPGRLSRQSCGVLSGHRTKR